MFNLFVLSCFMISVNTSCMHNSFLLSFYQKCFAHDKCEWYFGNNLKRDTFSSFLLLKKFSNHFQTFNIFQSNLRSPLVLNERNIFQHRSLSYAKHFQKYFLQWKIFSPWASDRTSGYLLYVQKLLIRFIFLELTALPLRFASTNIIKH